MVLHTIIREYDIFRDPSQPDGVCTCLPLQGRYLECEQTSGGLRLRRMISTDPRDYLDPAWQPGRALRQKGRTASSQ